jgi:pilus assembly protein Flp/PilA
MIQRIKDLIRDEEGATMPEYALMVSLIAVAAIIAVRAVGTAVSARLNEVATAIGP